jgi:hypothetical protein
MKRLLFGRLSPYRLPQILEPTVRCSFEYSAVQHALQRAKDNPNDRTRASLMEILGA